MEENRQVPLVEGFQSRVPHCVSVGCELWPPSQEDGKERGEWDSRGPRKLCGQGASFSGSEQAGDLRQPRGVGARPCALTQRPLWAIFAFRM